MSFGANENHIWRAMVYGDCYVTPIVTARIWRMGKVMFSVCSHRGRGAPSPIILPLPQIPSGGVPLPWQDGVPPSRWGWGTSCPGEAGVPNIQERMGTLPVQDRMGTPPPIGYAGTMFGVGSTPLAVSGRRTVLLWWGLERRYLPRPFLSMFWLVTRRR